MRFYPGLHHPSAAQHFERAFISVNAIRARKSGFAVGDWIMDSGAFTEISTHGRYRHGVEEYAEQVARWGSNGKLVAAVAQDLMCEPFILSITGRSVGDHQRETIDRYVALLEQDPGVPIMPVLQGWAPHDYVQHIRLYADLLEPGAYVGVGSVCKRNARPDAIMAVLAAIRDERPDLRLHGFGLKTTALCHGSIRSCLYSADSMAWSYRARIEGRNGNDWREAMAFCQRIEAEIAKGSEGAAWQPGLPLFA